jgi:putative (di)nucleoside polyphosphate hydrolase
MGAHFRASVGTVVVGPDRLVLAVERLDSPGQWQFPQGGIKKAEEPEAAMWRELEEEVGLLASDVELVAETRSWLTYELPSGHRTRPKLGLGQTQRWYLLALEGDQSRIRVDGRELRAWEWMSLARLATITAPFRRSVYQQLLAAFGDRVS